VGPTYILKREVLGVRRATATKIASLRIHRTPHSYLPFHFRILGRLIVAELRTPFLGTDESGMVYPVFDVIRLSLDGMRAQAANRLTEEAVDMVCI